MKKERMVMFQGGGGEHRPEVAYGKKVQVEVITPRRGVSLSEGKRKKKHIYQVQISHPHTMPCDQPKVDVRDRDGGRDRSHLSVKKEHES